MLVQLSSSGKLKHEVELVPRFEPFSQMDDVRVYERGERVLSDHLGWDVADLGLQGEGESRELGKGEAEGRSKTLGMILMATCIVAVVSPSISSKLPTASFDSPRLQSLMTLPASPRQTRLCTAARGQLKYREPS